MTAPLATPPVQALLTELQSDDWQTSLQRLPGYSGYSGDRAQGGQVLSLRAVLPWWSYRRPKPG